MLPRVFLAIAGSLFTSSCVSESRISSDHDFNYGAVFSGMREPKPAIVNSRLERYTKSLGPIQSRERNGSWEFEIVASRDWVNEALHGFQPHKGFAASRKPQVPWWTPTPRDYEAFEMPYSSYPAAHLYVEKHPKDPKRIHAFVQRY